MAEAKEISTSTTLNIIGDNISIFTFYDGINSPNLQENGDFSSIVDPLLGFKAILRTFPFTITTTTNISNVDGFNLAILKDLGQHLLSDAILDIGETYDVYFDITKLTDLKSVFIYQTEEGSPHSLIQDFTSIGTKTIRYIANRTRLSFFTNASDFFSGEASIDNITIRKVNI